MTAFGLPILATLALWWGSTGILFYVDSLPRRTFPWTIAGATVLAGFAIWGLAATSGDTTSGSAYAAFSYGLICWGWQIVTYYTGFVSGPAKTACPPGLRGLARFVAAVRTSLYHELSALTGAVVLLALTHNQPNQLGVWTYMTLWWMHESAKLNIYFGVPNLGEEMLPEHLRFLATYMTRRPMNMFFPVSVTLSTVFTMLLAQHALAAATPFETIGYTMLATLMGLAVAEHWFLVAPMNANVLWAPAMNRPEAAAVSAMLDGEFAALDISEDAASVAAGRESWSVALPALCDARNFAHVLELVAAGAFGEVDAVKGAIRTPANWIAFEFNGGKARMAPFAPRQLSEPLIVATGRRFDRARLRAALESCAA